MTNGVQRNYKNSLFLMIFRDKQALLRLYNAIRGSSYTDPEDLTVTTLENVLYLGMKNDVSFIIGNELNLYEAQSTWNPNMPLRGLFYFARLYQGYVAEHKLNIYSAPLLQLPTPRYVVLYNGQEKDADRMELRLSESFNTGSGEEPCLECVATMININPGHSQELLDNCRDLYEYSYLVDAVRNGKKHGLSLADAIDQAVDLCIKHDILAEFLLRHRAEVKNVILEEFDMEEHLKLVQSNAFREGEAKGLEKGRAEGEAKGLEKGRAEGEAKGLEKGRAEGIVRFGLKYGVSKGDILEQLQDSLEVTLQKAEEYFCMFEKE